MSVCESVCRPRGLAACNVVGAVVDVVAVVVVVLVVLIVLVVVVIFVLVVVRSLPLKFGQIRFSNS